MWTTWSAIGERLTLEVKLLVLELKNVTTARWRLGPDITWSALFVLIMALVLGSSRALPRRTWS